MAHDHGHDHGHNHHSPETPKVPKYWHTMDKEWGPEQEIGRASCRERV
mgnify:CR=1 FL=1